jgi:hypothetical protein
MNLIHCTLHTDQRYFNDIDVVTGNKMGWLVQKCIHLHSTLNGTAKSETDVVIHQMKMALDDEETRPKELLRMRKRDKGSMLRRSTMPIIMRAQQALL